MRSLRPLFLVICALGVLACDGGDDDAGNVTLAVAELDELTAACITWRETTSTEWHEQAVRLECYAEARRAEPAACEAEALTCISSYQTRPLAEPNAAALQNVLDEARQRGGCLAEIRLSDLSSCFREIVDGYALEASQATCRKADFPETPACDALFECDEFESSNVWSSLLDDAQCLWLPSALDFE